MLQCFLNGVLLTVFVGTSIHYLWDNMESDILPPRHSVWNCFKKVQVKETLNAKTNCRISTFKFNVDAWFGKIQKKDKTKLISDTVYEEQNLNSKELFKSSAIGGKVSRPLKSTKTRKAHFPIVWKTWLPQRKDILAPLLKYDGYIPIRLCNLFPFLQRNTNSRNDFKGIWDWMNTS